MNDGAKIIGIRILAECTTKVALITGITYAACHFNKSLILLWYLVPIFIPFRFTFNVSTSNDEEDL